MKKCMNCGFEGQDGNFCPGCGGNLVEAEQIQQFQEAPQPEVSYQPPQMEPQPTPYQPPVQEYVPVANEEVSVGNWIVSILLCAIPCVNLIMLFVWAFGGGAPKSKSNWAKAQLIFLAISVVLSLLVSIVMAIAGVSLMSGTYY